jgi:kynureninase
MTDLIAYRERFPILRERSYFTSPCLGPFPEEALSDLQEYRDTLFLRNRALGVWVERMYELVALLEDLLHAPGGSVALQDSATAAQATIAAALEPSGDRTRIVLTPALDFKSSRYLWTAQTRRGFSIVEVGHGEPWLSADELCAAIDERVSIVALPLVSSQTGALLPVEKVTAHARRMGAVTIVDAYQAVGIVPVDVQALGADVVVGGTHKWMCGSSMGLAFMFVQPELSERLQPSYPGWVGHADLTSATPSFEPAPGAQRFQQGSPAIEPIYTARAGIKFLLDVGINAIRERSLILTERVMNAARENGLHVRTPAEPECRGGMLCIDIPEPDEVVAALAAEGIDVDSRVDSGLRVGPFPCLDEEECEQLVARISALTRR